MCRRLGRSAVCLVVAAIAFAAVAADDDGDPLQSPDCRRAVLALDALDAPGAADAAASAARSGSARDPFAAERDALRKQAARACLGGRPDPPPARRIAQPPVAVSPVTLSPPAPIAMPLLPPAALRTPPIAVLPPVAPAVVTSCDAGGCWASDGTRLQRSGPAYVTPRGLCRVETGIVRCP